MEAVKSVGASVGQSVEEGSLAVSKKKNRGLEQWILDGICILYILFLIVGLLFKFKGFEAIKNLSKGFEFTWNPRLGYATLSKYSLREHLEVWGNLAIFIPLGCFFSINNKKGGWWHIVDILVVMSFSVFIELSQAIFAIGMGDIRDIILNTSGGAIGIYLYKLLKVMFKSYADMVFTSALAIAMIGFTWAAFTYMDGGFR